MYRMCVGHERMQRLSLDYGDQYTTDMSRTSIRGGIHDLHSPNLITRPPCHSPSYLFLKIYRTSSSIPLSPLLSKRTSNRTKRTIPVDQRVRRAIRRPSLETFDVHSAL